MTVLWEDRQLNKEVKSQVITKKNAKFTNKLEYTERHKDETKSSELGKYVLPHAYIQKWSKQPYNVLMQEKRIFQEKEDQTDTRVWREFPRINQGSEQL